MSKKYKLHEITEREAIQIALSSDTESKTYEKNCYCLANKDGKLFKKDGAVAIFKGKSTADSTLERKLFNRLEAQSYFKILADEKGKDMKMLKAGKLLMADLSESFIVIPDTIERINLCTITSEDIAKEAEGELYLRKVHDMCASLSNLDEYQSYLSNAIREKVATQEFELADVPFDEALDGFEEDESYEEEEEDAEYDYEEDEEERGL